MVFNAPRCDADIKKQMKEEYKGLDPNPTVPMNKAWDMRPRDKKNEVGPQFRFKHRSQLQRLHETLKNQIHNEFADYQNATPMLDEKIRRFVHTGQYQYVNDDQSSKKSST